jgi:hypothetical protein
MKSKKIDTPLRLKDRFFVSRKEIHNRYPERQKTEQQTDCDTQTKYVRV